MAVAASSAQDLPDRLPLLGAITVHCCCNRPLLLGEMEAVRESRMKRQTYMKYRQTAQWKELQEQAIRQSPQCFSCQAAAGEFGVTLIARHRSFKRFGKEQISDLEVVCEQCRQDLPDRMPSRVDWRHAAGWPDLAILRETDWGDLEPLMFETWLQTRSWAATLVVLARQRRKARRRKYASPSQAASLEPAILESLVTESAEDALGLSDFADAGLTARQWQIAEQLMKGFTQDEIGTMVGLRQPAVAKEIAKLRAVLKNFQN